MHAVIKYNSNKLRETKNVKRRNLHTYKSIISGLCKDWIYLVEQITYAEANDASAFLLQGG